MIFECEYCDYSTGSKQGLGSHTGKKHTENIFYNDKEELERLYVEEGLSITRIADRSEHDWHTIANKVDEFGIEKPPKPWEDPEELDRLYNEEGLSTIEIGDEMGCNPQTVTRKMEEYGIERRSRSESIHLAKAPSSTPASFSTIDDGYSVWQDYNDDEETDKQVRVHQLLACLDHDPHKVFADENVVHHGNNNHPYLPEVEHRRANWEGNLEVMSRSEHQKHHDSLGIQEPRQPKEKSAMDW